MHRFFLPPERCHNESLLLDGREAHHALNVLRLRKGERVVVLDGAGHEFLCETTETDRDSVRLAVVQKTLMPPLPFRITLLQAVPKGKSFEAILQKATELGVARVVPLLSERVVTQLEAEDADHKAEKWHWTLVEAMKQCGNAWLPAIESALPLKAFLARAETFDLTLIASLQSDSRHPWEYFHAYHAEHRRLPASVGIWVGPEGDFTPAEIAAAKSAGALPITLGRLVLRSETAAIYCLAMLNYELQSPQWSKA